jgi:acyl-CoA thioesterase-1
VIPFRPLVALAAALLLPTACQGRREPPARPPSDGGPAARTLVFLGDSLTEGAGVAGNQAYPALVQEMIRADGLDWRVINAGVSGDTTEDGLRRVRTVLATRPDLVMVALGANDGLREFDVHRIRDNLELIVARLQDAGAGVAVAGMLLPASYDWHYRQRFRSLFESIAAERRVPLLPFLLEGVGGVRGLNQPDGLHPNADGHRVMARHVYAFVKPLLVRQAP